MKEKEKFNTTFASNHTLKALEFDKIISQIAAYAKSFEGSEELLNTVPTACAPLIEKDKALAKCALVTVLFDERKTLEGWPKVCDGIKALKTEGFVSSAETLFAILTFSKSAQKAKKDFGISVVGNAKVLRRATIASGTKNTDGERDTSGESCVDGFGVVSDKSLAGNKKSANDVDNKRRATDTKLFTIANGAVLSGQENFSTHKIQTKTFSQKDTVFSKKSRDGAFFSDEANSKLNALEEAVSKIGDLSEVEKVLAAAFNPDGTLRDTPLLSRLREKTSRLKSKALFALQEALAKARTLGVLESTVSVLRGSFEALAVKASQKNAVPGIVVGTSASSQTLFITPAAVVEVNNELAQVESEIEEEVRRILRTLSAFVHDNSTLLLDALVIMAKLDKAFCVAQWAKNCGGTFCATADNITLYSVRHSLVVNCVPLDIVYEKNKRILIITGANAGGKSVALKTLALAAALNQAGFAVPASEGSALPIFDALLLDMGDEQSLSEHLSTYAAHLKNITKITTRATKKSLVIMDELGSGTDNTEGSAIAMGTLDVLGSFGSFVAASTHQSAIKEYAQSNENCMSAAVEFVFCKNGPDKKGATTKSSSDCGTYNEGVGKISSKVGSPYKKGTQGEVATLSSTLTMAAGSKDGAAWSGRPSKNFDNSLYKADFEKGEGEEDFGSTAPRAQGGTWRPTYKLLMGTSGASHAIDVARTVGLSPLILKKAREYLKSGGADAASLIKGLSKKISKADKTLSELRVREAKLLEKAQKLEKRKKALEESEAALKAREKLIETDFVAKTRRELEALVRTLREGEITREKTLGVKSFITKLNAHLDDYDKDSTNSRFDGEGLKKSAKSEKSFESTKGFHKKSGEQEGEEFLESTSTEGASDKTFFVGQNVRLKRTLARGIVAGLEKKGRVKVAFGAVVMEVGKEELESFGDNKKEGATVSYSVEYADGKGEKPVFELRLLGMRREEAIEALERQLDLCLVHNTEYFCVIHGKGEGVLKEAVKEVLNRYKTSIKGLSFEDAPSEDGGAGKTYVHLR